MGGRETVKMGYKHVRPMLSTNAEEAHTRVLGLYRAFYRYIPYIVKYFDIPYSEEACRCKLRECFYKNAKLTDIRIIDLFVVKGYIELKEITHQWQQKSHIMAHWNPTAEPKPTTFIGKFLDGQDD